MADRVRLIIWAWPHETRLIATRDDEIEPGEWIILLSEHIINDFTMDLFSHLVVVAPAALLGELLAALDEPTRDSVLGTVEADLLNVPDQALWPHLCAWLPPIAGP